MGFRERYDRFGWDYERFRVATGAEVDWVLRHARGCGGPVLELACGTGTLLGPIAAAGFEVTGLDLSPRMLDLARRRVARLPAQVRRRIRLVEDDMARFDLRRRFGVVLIADNSFREVETTPGLRAVLACARRHLRPGGRLLIAESRFDPARFPGGVREVPWSEPVEDPETGARVRRRVTVRADPEAGRVEGEMLYRIERADGTTRDAVFTFSGPLLRPEDYRALLEEAGFEVTIGSGYRDEDDGTDPVLNLVAAVAGPA
jgi:SAM-dependent methyltransferase